MNFHIDLDQTLLHAGLTRLCMNSVDGHLTQRNHPTLSLDRVLSDRLATLPRAAPILIMVNGYGFAPGSARRDPHETIYAERDTAGEWQAKSWFNGFAQTSIARAGGLLIGFGWNARSAHALAGPAIAQTYARAGPEARQLAKLINMIHNADPTRRVDIIAHSLGARVCLGSLANLKAANVGRIIMLGAAEYGAIALNAISSRAARHTQIYNIVARQNAVHDWVFDANAPRPGALDHSIGINFPFASSNWVDVIIDDARTQQKLCNTGIVVKTQGKVICPHSFHLDPSVFEFYDAILSRKKGFDPVDLSQMLGPVTRNKPLFRSLPFPSLSARLLHHTGMLKG